MTHSPTSTWPGLADDGSHSRWYTEHMRSLADRGQDVQGESRLVDVLAPRGARLLDAGCGPGRHGGHLATLGFDVVGADVDPALIEAAREDHPAGAWVVADLDALLPAAGLRLEHRFATWDPQPWQDDAEFAVSVLRRDG